MTIDELITFCKEKEYNHRLSCKRYDDASGYTRSKAKSIRTACAIREEKYADYYKEISAIMRKYQEMQGSLDKVRSEIEQEYTKLRNKSDMWNERACGLGTALEIIDKYKAESEE